MTRRASALVIEYALAMAVVASLAWCVAAFRTNGFLPQPFVMDTNDTFMDWFNTAYWANRPGAYDVWKTIYPPLSFVFLDIFTLPGCYVSSPFAARDCDWLSLTAIGLSYLANVILLWIAFRRNDPASALPRTVAMGLGLPLLFTLERGNLILVAMPAFILAHDPLVRSRLVRAVAAAVTINFKPYLLLPAMAWLVRRKWRSLEWAGLATIAVYLLTLAFVGSGTPGDLATNTVDWIIFQSGQVWNEVNYATSYAPLLTIRKASPLPLLDFVPSQLVEGVEFAVPLLIRMSQIVALCALAGIWLQPRAASHSRVALLLLGAYLVTQSPGGYTQIFVLFLVMLEKWEGWGPKIAIVSAYLLCLVGDVPISTILEIKTNGWLSGRPVTPSFGLAYGHFIRPGLMVVILWALAFDTITRVIRAHHQHRPSLGLMPA